ncbi:hypothetical protein ACRAWC_22575 [Leifsonia sp. L25]|uniref:hypothetical protein n=1 Tax=Leifsonia sp. L25 TaxID=3423957 RepID=UPI003D685CD2
MATGLGWSPLGAVWAVPGAVAAGDPIGALLRLIIALATFGVLWAVWRWGLARSLVTPARASSRVRAPGKSGLFGVLPGTPGVRSRRAASRTGSATRATCASCSSSRCCPRSCGSTRASTTSTGYIFAAGPVVAFSLGIGMIADVSYDSTAFALHVSKSVPGRADRWGRAAALLTFAVPAVVVVTVGAAALEGDWLPAPGLLGLSLGMLLAGVAVCSVTSARFVFPVPEPGDNPFRSRPGANISLLGPTFAAWGVIAVLSLPEIVLLVVSLVTREAVWGWLGLLAAVVLGGVLLVVGVRVGGRLLDRRAPELLQQLRKDG